MEATDLGGPLGGLWGRSLGDLGQPVCAGPRGGRVGDPPGGDRAWGAGMGGPEGDQWGDPEPCISPHAIPQGNRGVERNPEVLR